MKSSFFLFLAVVIPFCRLLPAQSFDVPLEVRYDRFDNVTTISTVPSKVSNALARKQEARELHLQVTYECKGDTKSCRPDNIELRFLSRSAGEYTGSDQLTFLADGQRIHSSVRWRGEYEQKILTEHVIATVNLEEFMTLANADKVEGRLGGTTFAFSDDNVTAIRALADKIR